MCEVFLIAVKCLTCWKCDRGRGLKSFFKLLCENLIILFINQLAVKTVFRMDLCGNIICVSGLVDSDVWPSSSAIFKSYNFFLNNPSCSVWILIQTELDRISLFQLRLLHAAFFYSDWTVLIISEMLMSTVYAGTVQPDRFWVRCQFKFAGLLSFNYKKHSHKETYLIMFHLANQWFTLGPAGSARRNEPRGCNVTNHSFADLLSVNLYEDSAHGWLPTTSYSVSSMLSPHSSHWHTFDW